jgi:hypothetical protein
MQFLWQLCGHLFAPIFVNKKRWRWRWFRYRRGFLEAIAATSLQFLGATACAAFAPGFGG